MPVLVTYDSSDEDSEGPPAKVNDASADRNGDESSHIPATSPSLVNPKSVHEESKPILGPSIPSDADQSNLNYEEDLDVLLPDLPEQDLLRYLTQPTYTAQIPPEPTGSADPAVTAKFKRFLQLKSKGIHFNEDLASKSSFKNPSLFANLLERTGLSAEAQYASTLPKTVFDPDSLPSWAFKEELLRSHQAYAAELNAIKKVQSSNGKRVIEFTLGNRGSTSGVQQKRKRPEE